MQIAHILKLLFINKTGEHTMASPVARIAAADSTTALAHFKQLLEFETDCWDVHFAMSNHRQDFVLTPMSMILQVPRSTSNVIRSVSVSSGRP